MWISQRAWRKLTDRVSQLERLAGVEATIAIPFENSKPSNTFVARVYGYEHASVGQADVIAALAQVAGLRWVRGEAGHLTARKGHK